MQVELNYHHRRINVTRERTLNLKMMKQNETHAQSHTRFLRDDRS